MNIFLVNQDNLNAQSLCKKLSKAKEGEFVQLTTQEFELHDSVDFQHVRYGNSENSNIVEVEEGKSYIFVCDQDTNIDDVMETTERLNTKYGIIRVN